MKVLWICNRAIPVAAKHLHIDCGNKEGWLAGLSEKLLSLKEENLELGICFPLNDRPNLNERCEVAVYTFAEDPVRFELYDEALEGRFREIFEDFKPDVIHIFGTEYSHTLAACLAFEKKEKRDKEIADNRRSQVGTGDRSEKIRTYNFPETRITDHRIKLTIYKMQQFLDGDLDEMIDALITFDQTEKLKNSSTSM